MTGLNEWGGDMRKAVLVLSVSAFLSGCQSTVPPGGFVPGGPTFGWQKDKTTRQQRADAGTECLIQAVREVPATISNSYNPGFSTPGQTYCNTIGSSIMCNQAGGINIPPSMTSFDANARLRKDYADMCMRKKGYTMGPTKFCLTPDDKTSEDCLVPR